MTKTEYQSVCFKAPARVRPGKRVDSLEAVAGVVLTRVTDESRDDLLVTGVPIPAEVPWHNVASAIRKAVEEPEKKAKKADS